MPAQNSRQITIILSVLGTISYAAAIFLAWPGLVHIGSRLFH
jgi:hypothetical protein